MSKNYRSEAMASIHETMEALHKAGAIDAQTMRRFGEACLNPRPRSLLGSNIPHSPS